MANQFERAVSPINEMAHDIDGADESATIDYALRNRVLRVRGNVIPDALAADTWTRTIMIADKAVNITAISIVPDAALTAHDTNYATLSFGTGPVGTITSKDSFTTKITGGSGDWVANTAESFTVVTSTDSLAAGECLTISKAVAGAGVIVPGFLVEVHYNYANA